MRVATKEFSIDSEENCVRESTGLSNIFPYTEYVENNIYVLYRYKSGVKTYAKDAYFGIIEDGYYMIYKSSLGGEVLYMKSDDLLSFFIENLC
jgi:hypothetical protein